MVFHPSKHWSTEFRAKSEHSVIESIALAEQIDRVPLSLGSTEYRDIQDNSGNPRTPMLPVSILHVVGWLAIAVGLSFTILYFYTRRSLARDKKAAGSKIS